VRKRKPKSTINAKTTVSGQPRHIKKPRRNGGVYLII
jgi:hypothetical protein